MKDGQLWRDRVQKLALSFSVADSHSLNEYLVYVTDKRCD